MTENQPKTSFELDLKDHGGLLRFSSSADLNKWYLDEIQRWKWLQSAPQGQEIYGRHMEFYNQIPGLVERWNIVQGNQQKLEGFFKNLEELFQRYYSQQQIINSSSPEGIWLLDLCQKRKPTVASGAYHALLKRPFPNVINDPNLIEGIIEGFLYTRKVDWTGSANQEILNRLKSQYDQEISNQNSRFKEIEERNNSLNALFENTLNEKTSSLDHLHENQNTEFKKVIGKHETNLKAIEQAYDQKLALQKPVQYWRTREQFHSRRSQNFGIASLIVGVISAVLYGLLVFRILNGLSQEVEPKSWQLGIMVVAAFFLVWLVRILVRLFFSHLHLATDAAERRIMILTYLSMAREGTQFATEDKTLIVQHLFRTASDGLVKDDAAPPTLLEFLTRK